jgi:hypothetical protein
MGDRENKKCREVRREVLSKELTETNRAVAKGGEMGWTVRNPAFFILLISTIHTNLLIFSKNLVAFD